MYTYAQIIYLCNKPNIIEPVVIVTIYDDGRASREWRSEILRSFTVTLLRNFLEFFHSIFYTIEIITDKSAFVPSSNLSVLVTLGLFTDFVWL